MLTSSPGGVSIGASSLGGASIVVTGGGSGIGRAVAQRLVGLGARATICGRRAEVITRAADDLGPTCLGVTADAADAADRQRLLADARSHGGGIGAIVHCAADLALGPVSTLDPETAMRLFNNNVVSGLMLVSAALPDLAAAKGSVVFFSSSHTQRPSANIAAYAASKAAVEAATASLAVELGPQGIRVNCIRPGAVPTEILERGGLNADVASERLQMLAPRHALGRLGTPEEIAHAVEYLLTAPWTTGIVLGVDGGYALGV